MEIGWGDLGWIAWISTGADDGRLCQQLCCSLSDWHQLSYPCLLHTKPGLYNREATHSSLYLIWLLPMCGIQDRMSAEMSGLYLCCCCKHGSITIMHEINLLHCILNKRGSSACSMLQVLNTHNQIFRLETGNTVDHLLANSVFVFFTAAVSNKKSTYSEATTQCRV